MENVRTGDVDTSHIVIPARLSRAQCRNPPRCAETFPHRISTNDFALDVGRFHSGCPSYDCAFCEGGSAWRRMTKWAKCVVPVPKRNQNLNAHRGIFISFFFVLTQKRTKKSQGGKMLPRSNPSHCPAFPPGHRSPPLEADHVRS